MEEQFERWELASGTWLRNLASEEWRLLHSRSGTPVDPGVPVQDVARLVEARRGGTAGEWFPPEFNYSLHTGEPLAAPGPTVRTSWLPPFGASALPGAGGHTRGLRQTPASLAIARAHERTAARQPDRVLPPLPRGQYRFVVDAFDTACPTLVAVEPELGEVSVLLPESNRWMPLARTTGISWAQRLRNRRGWRMELLHDHGRAIAFCPSDLGLAAITPTVFGLRYGIESAGESAALGGPVAWRGEIWMPIIGKGDVVHLLGRPCRASGHMHIVLPTRVPVPLQGFEAPVFDETHVIWPCEEGQLVLRLDADGEKEVEWMAWPGQVKPVFALGCPFVDDDGTFWQLCRTDDDGRFAYVRMAQHAAEAAPIDGLHVGTGRVSYRGTSRIDEAPWRAAPANAEHARELVIPLLESTRDGAVLGLRMEAPRGALALLQGGSELRRAVLQVEVPGRPAVSFGAIAVKRAWLALPFVHDGHVWLHHPDLVQGLGWELSG